MAIYSWRTAKVGNKYKYSVLRMIPRKTKNRMGHYADTKIVRSGILSTRARAMAMAQRWVRYYNSKK